MSFIKAPASFGETPAGVTHQDVVLLPFWFHERLKSKGLRQSMIMNFNKISKLFSMNDLAGLLAVQQKSSYLTNITSQSFTHVDDNSEMLLISSWRMTCYGDEDTVLCNNVVQMSSSPQVSNDIDARLFSGCVFNNGVKIGAPDDLISDYRKMIEDNIEVIDAGLMLFTVGQGWFAAEHGSTNAIRGLVSEVILQTFYRTIPAYMVSRSKWFTCYLNAVMAGEVA